MNNYIQRLLPSLLMLFLITNAIAQSEPVRVFGFNAGLYKNGIAPQSRLRPNVLSLLRIKPVASLTGQSGVMESNDAWNVYYRKQKAKGIGMTTAGSVLLAGGIGVLTYGLLDIAMVINQNKYYTTYRSYSSGSYSSNTITWNNSLQTTENPFDGDGLDVSLICLGSVSVLAGIILLPLGSKFLHRAIIIKREAAIHNILVSVSPVINPAVNNYSCSLKFDF